MSIVEYGEVDYSALPVWRLADSAMLRLGVVQGDPALQWDDLVSASRLRDGTLIALDRGSRQVRAFSAEGDHLWTTGGEGEGPGEYRFPWAVTAVGDRRLAVTDAGTRRVTWIDHRGQLLGTTDLSFAEGQPVGGWGATETGVLVELRTGRREQRDRHQVAVFTSTFLVVDPDGEEPLELGAF